MKNFFLFSLCFFLFFSVSVTVSFATDIASAEPQRDISFTLLGAYKKAQPYFDELKTHLDKYEKEYNVSGLNLWRVLKSIVVYEAGSNRTLISEADAHDLMQVIESTRVDMGKRQGPSSDPMKKFSVGDEVTIVTRRGLNVREKPGLGSSRLTILKNHAGKIVDGPVFKDNYIWWKIEYTKSLIGWSADVGLAKDMTFNEAGVKFLAYLAHELRKYLVHKYGNFSLARLQDLIVVGYNGGPGRAKGAEVKVESYQYREGTSIIFQVLSQSENQIKNEINNLELVALEKSHTWIELKNRFGVSLIELRLLNSFLAARYFETVPKGEVLVYPKEPTISFETREKDGKIRYFYVSRHGDILHHIANAFFRSSKLASKPPNSVYDYFRGMTGVSMWGILYPGIWIDVTESPYLNKDY